jgi:hypothetical protein
MACSCISNIFRAQPFVTKPGSVLLFLGNSKQSGDLKLNNSLSMANGPLICYIYRSGR